MKSRVKEAERLFKEEGYNCAQAVFLAYSDLYGLDRNTAVRLSSGLGGGVGRMREVCGTVLGMSLLVGLEEGSLDPRDIQAKRHTYEVVQKMAAEFKKKNGSVICRELLGLEKAEQNPMPEARTEIYYKKRDVYKRQGMTSLMKIKNISKSDDRIQLLGAIEELISQLGVIKSKEEGEKAAEDIEEIQKTLITVMSGVADQYNREYKLKEDAVKGLEEKINRMESIVLNGQEFVPVSYTHLDVYKRQGYDYSDLIDVFEGNDRYAREILQYRLDQRRAGKEEEAL